MKFIRGRYMGTAKGRVVLFCFSPEFCHLPTNYRSSAGDRELKVQSLWPVLHGPYWLYPRPSTEGIVLRGCRPNTPGDTSSLLWGWEDLGFGVKDKQGHRASGDWAIAACDFLSQFLANGSLVGPASLVFSTHWHRKLCQPSEIFCLEEREVSEEGSLP